MSDIKLIEDLKKRANRSARRVKELEAQIQAKDAELEQLRPLLQQKASIEAQQASIESGDSVVIDRKYLKELESIKIRSNRRAFELGGEIDRLELENYELKHGKPHPRKNDIEEGMSKRKELYRALNEEENQTGKQYRTRNNIPIPVMPELAFSDTAKAKSARPPWFKPPRIR